VFDALPLESSVALADPVALVASASSPQAITSPLHNIAARPTFSRRWLIESMVPPTHPA